MAPKRFTVLPPAHAFNYAWRRVLHAQSQVGPVPILQLPEDERPPTPEASDLPKAVAGLTTAVRLLARSGPSTPTRKPSPAREKALAAAMAYIAENGPPGTERGDKARIHEHLCESSSLSRSVLYEVIDEATALYLTSLDEEG